jgi:hypothetical protein
MNETLRDIHGMLLDQHDALSKRLGKTTDSQTARSILIEMQEMLHRIDLVQGLLFRQTSEALESTLADIQQANQRLSVAIETMEDSTEFLKSAASYLETVDRAIDIAKLLAPLAA